MPAFSARYNPITETIYLNNGTSLAIADIPGNGWPQARLDLARDLLLAMTEDRQVQADLPVEDPDRTMTNAELFAIYGNRRFLEQVGGVTYIVSRGTDFEVTWDGERLRIGSRVID